MNCFVCSRTGLTEAAIANCTNCGSGLCPDHLNEVEITITKTVPLGPEQALPLKARRMLCEKCEAALSQKGAGRIQ